MLVLADVVDQLAAVGRGQNLDTAFVILPLEVALTIWTMAAWQPTEKLRRLYGWFIVSMLIVTTAAYLLTGPAAIFLKWVSPVLALAALISTIHTLVGRTLLSRSHLMTEGWFWACLGMGVFWTGFISVPMFAAVFLDTHLSWVVTAYTVRAWTNVGAFLLITWGVLCPLIRSRSSGSSLAEPSPSS